MAEFDHQISTGKSRLCAKLGISGVGAAPVSRRVGRGRTGLDLPYDWENFGCAVGGREGESRRNGVGGVDGAAGLTGLAVDDSVDKPRRRKVPRVKAPVISPDGGSFDQMVEIWISCATEDSNVYYCIDQKWEPSSAYVGSEGMLVFEHEGMDTKPITLANQGRHVYKVQAIAMREHWKDSPIASATFVVQDPQADFKWDVVGPKEYVYDPACDVCPDWNGLNRKKWLGELWAEFVARRTRAVDADGVLDRWRPENIDFEAFWRRNVGALPPHLVDKPPHEQRRWFEEYFRGQS